MDQVQVFELLEKHQNIRGIDHWNKMENTGGLTSFGIGLTIQRKLAKQIGKNRELAQALWASKNYDAKVLSLLIDDPKQITFEQAEQQVQQLNAGMLRHVFSSCDATLAKSPIAFALTQRWLDSDQPTRRNCAFGLVYELSKKKSKIYTDEFFMSVIDDIAQNFNQEPKNVRLAMSAALMGIGKRNVNLNHAALTLAEKLGSIDFNEVGQNCDPFDVAKHPTSGYLRKKLGIE
ncbi:DNA alkylation repair protein [Thalassotalea atypica]|uniref:DNA alkylation repair protein n=1 Tax=Thalassotalea atypica TaxID=2054316 RepID=UPI0025723A09|nr:DNA alkylation repair protein [Thalassotalea atypica]